MLDREQLQNSKTNCLECESGNKAIAKIDELMKGAEK